MSGALTLPSGTSLRLTTKDTAFLAGTRRQMPFSSRILCKASAASTFTETARPVMNAGRSRSLYEVLRLKSNASPTEIKAAYRSLAKIYHPDSSSYGSSDGSDFVELRKAYTTLSDPTAKAGYDLSLAAGSGDRRSGYGSGFNRTRRWETDQCW